ncbi:thioredoxin-disulfide reductase [Thermanaeromonas sp. C210]|uniref:thioredoxin-disulfide reductase n=1 Tax=Thermanaeromonas sp. C210 TaxID=2731925 RepID=UPI00155CF61E|nr:thioredoxin-disulfide reductase [Thermanaeromonas sp. C210]GFN22383.1 pyridine nucleotide-disulfide oxidoreductase [Thermanaeromonas sp. C210]
MGTKEVDVLIIGGGPAGLTAGLYASRARLNTVILEKGRHGGQIATTQVIENWPGTLKAGGAELTDQMAEHARRFGCQIIKDEVVEVDFSGYEKVVKTKKQDTYVAKAVIIASGAEPRVLGIKGEREFRGRGVSYCATCDADFYTDASVVVVGNGDAAVEEAIYLTNFAAEVTLIVIHDEGILDATKVIQERAFANPKLKFKWNSVVEEIKGDEAVTGVVIRNIKTGQLEELPTEGVFFFVGTLPNTSFLQGKIEMDARGYIKANDMMETSVEGVYACGDCREKFLRQVVTAAADGAIAAMAAEKYIREEEFFRQEVLQQEKPVLLVFWSPMVEASLPVVADAEKLQEKWGDKIKVTKIDTYRNTKVARRYGIERVPAVLLLRQGQVVAQIRELEGEEMEKALSSLIS